MFRLSKTLYLHKHIQTNIKKCGLKTFINNHATDLKHASTVFKNKQLTKYHYYNIGCCMIGITCGIGMLIDFYVKNSYSFFDVFSFTPSAIVYGVFGGLVFGWIVIPVSIVSVPFCIVYYLVKKY